MSFGITKTIPQSKGIAAVNTLYDGSINEFEFHMAGNPSKLSVGDYVYTIFQDQIQIWVLTVAATLRASLRGIVLLMKSDQACLC